MAYTSFQLNCEIELILCVCGCGFSSCCVFLFENDHCDWQILFVSRLSIAKVNDSSWLYQMLFFLIFMTRNKKRLTISSCVAVCGVCTVNWTELNSTECAERSSYYVIIIFIEHLAPKPNDRKKKKRLCATLLSLELHVVKWTETILNWKTN